MSFLPPEFFFAEPFLFFDFLCGTLPSCLKVIGVVVGWGGGGP